VRFVSIADDVVLGKNVIIRDFVNLYGCDIGDNTKIGAFVEIQREATVGRNCKISCFTVIGAGVCIEDECFIGPHVCFLNDKYPRATTREGELKTGDDWEIIGTIVRRGASIGGGATILCGVTIGVESMIGAGAVVTKDVPPGTIAVGTPARVVGHLERRSAEIVQSIDKLRRGASP
jgi:UDP-2-acetamido-3-amino-2,3-dideoxy-glucuronate N-acetyltransferase